MLEAIALGQKIVNHSGHGSVDQYRLLFGGDPVSGRPYTIGEAVTRAKAAVIDPDTRRTWILSGDPSMKLK